MYIFSNNGWMKMKRPSEIRFFLLTYGIIVTYVSCIIMGIIIAKYQPWIMNIIDLTIFPISALSFFLLYLFSLTYEKKINVRLNEKTLECAKLYSKGLSFEKIKEKLELNHITDVKRMLIEFCKYRS